MRLFVLFFISVSCSLHSQINLSHWQTFQWDSALIEQSSYLPLSADHYPRLVASDAGFAISSKRWIDLADQRLLQELHFFNSSLEFDTSIRQGVVYHNFSFGGGEDCFSFDGKIYTLNFFRNCDSNDSTCNVHVFSCFSQEGTLLFSDTLIRDNFMPFFDGGLPVLREKFNFRVLNGDFVYYLSNSIQDFGNFNYINVVRFNLMQPETEVFPINLGINSNIYSFLGADISSILLEQSGPISNGNRPFSLESYSINGNLASSLVVGLYPENSGYTKVKDYLLGPDSNLIFYRMNYPSEQHYIEFLNDDLTIQTSLYIHNDSHDGAPIIYPPSSSSIYIVLDPRISTQANYRLLEIDLVSRSIVHDTLFPIPSVFYTAERPLFTINEALGEILLYGMVGDIPYIHKINVINKVASFDSIHFPVDNFFEQCDYFHVAAKGTEYFTVGLDNIEFSDGLNAYCFGKLDFPSSTSEVENAPELIQLFPNPAYWIVSLCNLPSEALEVRVVDLQGRLVYTQRSNRQNTLDIPIAQLSKGMYWVTVQGANGVKTQKFIKH